MKYVLSVLAAGLSLTGALRAQNAAGMSAELKAAYNSVKNNLLKSADKMPEENYAFKPMPEMRSFAEVLGHVASAQMHACGAALGEQKTAGGEDTSKATVMAALNAAFSECDRAYDALTDANASETIKTGRGERSRAGMLAGNIAHDNEQYGILSVYLRLKGVIPPSSEAAARKK
ncbi:MAG: DinB family protein [Acidobacteriaceae bacterium]|nr:DinB family protein [Acidobacteriaceae bacterium]